MAKKKRKQKREPKSEPVTLGDLVAAALIAELMNEAHNSEPGPHHDPDCPLYRPTKKKSSSGAVSNAYRKNWDAIFGKVPVGES